MKSLEHSNNFNIAKRMAKIIAPKFRVFSSERISRNNSILDLRFNTIEIGEYTGEIQAVSMVLFQLGHLRLRKYDRFNEHFGIFNRRDIEPAVMQKICKQGEEADKLAFKWAVEILQTSWQLEKRRAELFLEKYLWTEKQWKEYYKDGY